MSFDTFPHWTGHLFARCWIRICQNSRISRKENHIGDCWWILRQAMWNEKQKTNEDSNFCHSSLLWQTFSNWKCLLVFFDGLLDEKLTFENCYQEKQEIEHSRFCRWFERNTPTVVTSLSLTQFSFTNQWFSTFGYASATTSFNVFYSWVLFDIIGIFFDKSRSHLYFVLRILNMTCLQLNEIGDIVLVLRSALSDKNTVFYLKKWG